MGGIAERFVMDSSRGYFSRMLTSGGMVQPGFSRNMEATRKLPSRMGGFW